MDYSYVFSAKKKLELESNKKETVLFGKMKSKWAVAAAIALASGSAVLFAPVNKAQAAEVDPNAQTEQVDTTKKAVDDNATAVVGADKQNAQNGDAEKVAASVKNDATTNSSTVSTTENNKEENQKRAVVNNQQDNVNAPITQTSNVAFQNDQQRPDSVQEDADQPFQGSDVDEKKADKKAGKPLNYPDLVKGNVEDAWRAGYKGEHIAVAVIDTGADVTHKDFSTAPNDPKFAKEDIEKIISELGHGRYVSPKIPYVHNVVDNNDDNIKQIPKKDKDGSREVPHGQHVAGIIAADGHPDASNPKYIVGVAPEAQLMILRYFDEGKAQPQISDAIYDAVNAGADVISLSLGDFLKAQDLNEANQRAVQYAIEHGVVVSIAASNNGNSASVNNPSHIKDYEEKGYEPESNAGNYEPFNSGTISSPGVSKNAITVASETSTIDENGGDMSTFSGWGPLPDFTLKPDISAPGDDVISTINNNKYHEDSGTSMATPFVSGVAALVLERLKQTNPNLKGADLVQAVKGLIMSTANPQIHDGIIVSPRRQGAGQINAGAATQSPVYITVDDGTSSLSLRNISDSTSFDLTFHNLSDQVQTYTFDDLGGSFTEKRDPDYGTFKDVQLSGAHVDGQDTITIAPNSTAKFTYTLNLDGVKKNQLVEGYLHFEGDDDQPDLIVPYLGYYGDMTSEDVFDKDAGKGDPDIVGNHFDNENDSPLGIADDNSLDQITNKKDDETNEDKWAELAKKYDSGKVAFSPNDDGNSDILVPYTYLKQNIKDLKVEVLNEKGKVVCVVADAHDVYKSFFSDSDGKVLSGTTDYQWDGKIYDSESGKMIVAPDGKYTYRFIATLYNKGPHQIQTHDTSFIIDTTKPVLDDFKYDEKTHTVSGSYHDTGVGFTDYSYGQLEINDKMFNFKLNDGMNAFDNSEKTKGHFAFQLNDDELNALASVQNYITVTLSDVADNEGSGEPLAVAGVPESHQKITVWNAINHQAFSTDTDDYNEQAHTYTLYGSADHDFYINGKLVQVIDGQYEAAVDVTNNKFVFSSDQAGKDRLYVFTTGDKKKKDPISFELFNIDKYTVFGKDEMDQNTEAGIYDPSTSEYTVKGKVNPARVIKLVAVTHGNSENDPANIVNFDKKTGEFSFKFKVPKVGQKLIQFVYTTKNGKKHRGSIGARVDVEEPTIDLKLPTITNKPVLHLSGVVNDNMDGYQVIINGNNIFTQQNSGPTNYNAHPESGLSLNAYGPYNINYDINLNDQNGKPTDHIITVEVIDKLGNDTTKQFKVRYDPNYSGQSENNSGVEVPSISEKTISDNNPVHPVNNGNNTNNIDNAGTTDQDNALDLTLTHNAFVYDNNGKVVVTTDGKNTLLKKGRTISALHNGKITNLNGKAYVQIGDNAYVKLANTLLKKLVVHNSYLYNAQGKATGRVSKLHVIKHGKFLYVWNNGQKFTIKGKQFYRLVNGKFIKVANLQSVRAIKVTHFRARLYNENGKLLKKRITLSKGKYYWAWNNAKVVKINGKKYYRVGKNRYVRAVKAVVAKSNTALDADKLK